MIWWINFRGITRRETSSPLPRKENTGICSNRITRKNSRVINVDLVTRLLVIKYRGCLQRIGGFGGGGGGKIFFFGAGMSTKKKIVECQRRIRSSPATGVIWAFRAQRGQKISKRVPGASRPRGPKKFKTESKMSQNGLFDSVLTFRTPWAERSQELPSDSLGHFGPEGPRWPL